MSEPHLQTYTLPAEIERASMAMIERELNARGLRPEPKNAAVVKRVIHATADFDYAQTLCFTPDAVAHGVLALRRGTPVVTDTNMAKAGISKPCLARLNSRVCCFMADEAVAENARKNSTTRAAAAMRHAAEVLPQALLAVGNAPTALLEIAKLIKAGLRPALVVAVPVGFVNVVESKRYLMEVCEAFGVPAIAAMGNKGGSNVAAAICNALLYTALDLLDPSRRGWQ